MKKNSSVFYINMVLSVVALLLIVNAFSPTGHDLIKRALAAVGAITGEGTLNYVARFAGAQSPSNFIGNSIIYDSGTNVGIGTASPGAKLHVKGDTGIRIEDDSTANYWQFKTDSDGGLHVTEDNSLEKLTINNAGNVGIGTTSPGYKLTVGQNTVGDSSNYNLAILRNGTSASPGTYQAQGFYILDYAADGPSAGNDAVGIMNISAARIADADTYAGNATIFNIANDNGSAFAVKGNRRVGIGTTTPSTKLEVNYGASASVPLRLVSSSKFIDIGALNSTYAHFDTDTTSGFYFYDNVTTAGTFYGNGSGLTGIVATDSTKVAKTGDTMSGDLTFSNGRKSIVGVYNPSQTQAVWGMGPGYLLTDGGGSATYGNFYGLGWSYNPDYGGAGNNPQSKPGLNHQLLLMMAGVTHTAIGSGIWTIGNITASGGLSSAYYSGGVSGSSYGGIRITGTTGGYSGMFLDDGGNTVVGMYDTGGNGGIWDPTYGWQQYWHRGNASLGIGASTTSSSYKLYVSGNTYVTGSTYSGAFYYTSDERLKTNIQPLRGSLASVLDLEGVTFEWKKDGTRSIGLVAQDVEKIFPEAVSTDKDTGMKSINGSALSGPIVEAIKELNDKIEDQEKTIEQLEKEIEELKEN